jgi:hypothetical protein
VKKQSGHGMSTSNGSSASFLYIMDIVSRYHFGQIIYFVVF